MPRLTNAVPRLSKRTTGGICYAIVRLGGKTHYCGRWGTRASRAEYDRLIGEWLQDGRPSRKVDGPAEITVSDVVAQFWKWCKGYYPPRTAANLKPTLRDLRKRYGHVPAMEFGPKSLKALRATWIEVGSSRKYVNEQVSRVKQTFRWAVAEELCPVQVHQRLTTVIGLRAGKSEAREPEPVRPVSLEVFDATLPYLPEVLADLLRLQLLTGARPGEIADLRPGDVEMIRDPWEYRPADHKTKHHGKSRTILIGPRGQEILRPYLLRPADQRCFRPIDSEKRRRRERTEARTTPDSCGNVPGSNRKVKPKRKPGEAYGKDAINRAVRRAVEQLNSAREKQGLEPVARWSPNQLRHSAATLLRREFGLEAAQIILGHSKADVTQIYAERDLEKARDAMSRIG